MPVPSHDVSCHTVIAFGLLNGHVPNANDTDRMSFENLLYVICSRAKTNLYLISERGHLGKSAMTLLSRLRYEFDE
jgi:DNA helicase-2/ATP-dependent DNA helicase PcrA